MGGAGGATGRATHHPMGSNRERQDLYDRRGGARVPRHFYRLNIDARRNPQNPHNPPHISHSQPQGAVGGRSTGRVNTNMIYMVTFGKHLYDMVPFCKHQ